MQAALTVCIYHSRRGVEEEEELVCGVHHRRSLATTQTSFTIYKLKQVRLVICFFIFTIIITYLCKNNNISIPGCVDSV